MFQEIPNNISRFREVWNVSSPVMSTLIDSHNGSAPKMPKDFIELFKKTDSSQAARRVHRRWGQRHIYTNMFYTQRLSRIGFNLVFHMLKISCSSQLLNQKEDNATSPDPAQWTPFIFIGFKSTSLHICFQKCRLIERNSMTKVPPRRDKKKSKQCSFSSRTFTSLPMEK